MLKKSLVCITFGQPHIILPCVSEVARERPEVTSTIHTLHLHNDIIPRILPLLNECCSDLCPEEEKGEIKLKTLSTAKMVCPFKCMCNSTCRYAFFCSLQPFQDPLTLEVLDITWKLQEPDEVHVSTAQFLFLSCVYNHSTCCQVQKTDSSSKLKRLLSRILPHVSAKRPDILMYTAHRVLCESHPVGLVMREMSHEELELYSNCRLQLKDVENLQNDFHLRVRLFLYTCKLVLDIVLFQTGML